MKTLKTILLVDDEADIVSAMSFFLKRKGIEVLTAENGFEALKVIAEAPRKPDLILLDGNMPVMNARDFLKARREENIFPAIPVILLSSDLWDVDDSTIISHIPKPFDFLYLIEKIETYFPPAPRGEVSR